MALLLSWLLALLTMLQMCLLCVSGRMLAEEEKNAVLDAHNSYRKLMVREQSASNIRIMEWETDLEKFAESWASRCDFNNSPDPKRMKLPGEFYAWEKLPMDSPTKLNYAKLLGKWYDTIKETYIDDLDCKGACSQITQVFWSESYKVGCGISKKLQCPKGILVACLYAPEGNYSGRKAFLRGPPCSACKGVWKNFCIDGLCSKTGPRVFHSGTASRAQKTTAHVAFPVILLAATHGLCTT